MDCLFCTIAQGKTDTKLIYQDDKVVAFNDLHPQGPEHKIIISRKHIATLNEIQPEDSVLTGHMIECAVNIAKEIQIAENGYRLVWNCNAGGGQTIFHIHLHLIGGRSMTWPPG